jgi:hypothetical protein
MSKIKVQSPSSGTAVFTLTTASGTTTDRTITLPDSTDSLAGQTQVNRLGGRKNLIINGGFDVWQRSNDSGAGMSGSWGYYTADRIRTAINTPSGSQRIYRKTDDSTFPNVMAVVGDGSSKYTVGFYVEESERLINNKVTTFSFYAKVSSGTFDLLSEGHGAYASGLNYTSKTTTLTTSWQRVTITVDLSGSGYNGTNEMEFRMARDSIVPNGVELHLAQAQLELGSTATDFEHRSYGEELALCQRYYEKYNGVLAGGTDSTGSQWMPVFFKVSKRTTPTITQTLLYDTVSNINIDGLTINRNSSGEAYFTYMKADAEL